MQPPVNYSDLGIRDMLLHGLEDQDIQEEALGNENQDMTLDEMTKFFSIKEAGKRSQSSLLNPSQAGSASTR
jgi:hypothetical protein